MAIPDTEQVLPELAKLHDIHLPTPISSWALAPGWYVLMLLFTGVMLMIFLKIRRSRAQQRLKQQVLQMLISLEEEHILTPNSQKTCAAISELLRRIALMCYPRDRVAGLQGDAWLAFLSKTSLGALENKSFSIDFIVLHSALLEYPYQPPIPPEEAKPQVEALFQAARNWIKNQTLSTGTSRDMRTTGERNV